MFQIKHSFVSVQQWALYMKAYIYLFFTGDIDFHYFATVNIFVVDSDM